MPLHWKQAFVFYLKVLEKTTRISLNIESCRPIVGSHAMQEFTRAMHEVHVPRYRSKHSWPPHPWHSGLYCYQNRGMEHGILRRSDQDLVYEFVPRRLLLVCFPSVCRGSDDHQQGWLPGSVAGPHTGPGEAHENCWPGKMRVSRVAAFVRAWQAFLVLILQPFFAILEFLKVQYLLIFFWQALCDYFFGTVSREPLSWWRFCTVQLGRRLGRFMLLPFIFLANFFMVALCEHMTVVFSFAVVAVSAVSREQFIVGVVRSKNNSGVDEKEIFCFICSPQKQKGKWAWQAFRSFSGFRVRRTFWRWRCASLAGVGCVPLFLLAFQPFVVNLNILRVALCEVGRRFGRFSFSRFRERLKEEWRYTSSLAGISVIFITVRFAPETIQIAANMILRLLCHSAMAHHGCRTGNYYMFLSHAFFFLDYFFVALLYS